MSRVRTILQRWRSGGSIDSPGSARSGGSSDPPMEEARSLSQQEALERALAAVRADADVLVGPWTGEVGFELLYWIPFLGWLAAQGPGGRRMVVDSRGGTAPWYRHLTSHYVDILDLMSPEEFRAATAGKKKQYDARRPFDRDVLGRVRDRLGLGDGPVVHPSAMFRLFAGLWRKQAAVDSVESFSVFRRLTALPDTELPAALPANYVVAKFYFSKAFPDTQNNRAFVAETLRRVSRRVPVALLSTSMRLDEHVDFEAQANSGLFCLVCNAVPHNT